MNEKLPSKVLSYQEEQGLRQRAKELADVRDEVEVTQGVNFETKNKAEVQQEIGKIQATLNAQAVSEIDLSAVERQRVVEEERLLRADLQKDMPTWGQYVNLTPKSGSPYTALVNKIVQWNGDRGRRAKIQRWKTLRRLLDPHSPKADSTVHLFPQ